MDTLIKNLCSGDTSFCLIQKQGNENILVLKGQPYLFDRVKDIPRRYGTTNTTYRYDSISVIPFCQIREKGYDCLDDGGEVPHNLGQRAKGTPRS